MNAPNACKAVLVLTTLALAPGPAAAAPGPDWGATATGDEDRDAARRALQAADWDAAAAALAALLARRPFDDDAHAQLGFASRKRGDYAAALEHYRRALALNPHHRGAMAYMGEAYLELGDEARARAMLECLARTCRRAGRPPAGCQEWRSLRAAMRRASTRP